jgi:hypothetical protein
LANFRILGEPRTSHTCYWELLTNSILLLYPRAKTNGSGRIRNITRFELAIYRIGIWNHSFLHVLRKSLNLILAFFLNILFYWEWNHILGIKKVHTILNKTWLRMKPELQLRGLIFNWIYVPTKIKGTIDRI